MWACAITGRYEVNDDGRLIVTRSVAIGRNTGNRSLRSVYAKRGPQSVLKETHPALTHPEPGTDHPPMSVLSGGGSIRNSAPTRQEIP